MGRHAVAPVQLVVATAALALVPVSRAAAAEDCPNADLRPTRANLERVEAALVCTLNIERRRAGKPPVARDRRLNRSALRHTRDMIAHHYFAHQRRGERTLLGRIRRTGYFRGARSGRYSENLGYAPPERASAASMTHAFSLSESHRATMLYGRFRDIGIGAAFVDPDPAFYADYPAVVYTFDFGRRYERRRRCSTMHSRRWCRHRGSR